MTSWFQISSGRGPEECAWVVAQVLRVLTLEARTQAVSVELLDAVPARTKGAFHSVLLALEGERLAGLHTRWVGTIQWIGRSPFRPLYKRRNWFVGVEAFAEPQPLGASLADVKVETMRASGPGGQHVNKTESAVRMTHRPTGLTVTAREERSQAANRKLARARLAALLRETEQSQAERDRQRRWTQHDALIRGNPVRIFEGPGFRPRGT